MAIDPDSGRHELGTRASLNACLAGLLVAELLLEGAVGPGERDDSVVGVEGGPVPPSPILEAAALVVAEKGPKVKAILSHMSRGLEQQLDLSTWETLTSGLVDAGGVLSMTGPAHLLEVVAPERSNRKHARNRIDHALDDSALEHIGKVVRRVIQEAEAVAAAAIGGAGIASSS